MVPGATVSRLARQRRQQALTRKGLEMVLHAYCKGDCNPENSLSVVFPRNRHLRIHLYESDGLRGGSRCHLVDLDLGICKSSEGGKKGEVHSRTGDFNY